MQQPQRLQLLSAVVVVRMIGTSFPMLLRRMMTMLILLLLPLLAQAAPLSKPFISYGTDPYDQTVHHSIDWEHLQLEQQANEEKVTPKRQRPYLYDEIRTEQCPFQFIIGIAKTMMPHSSSATTADFASSSSSSSSRHYSQQRHSPPQLQQSPIVWICTVRVI
jgi:hypothetical protein